MSQPRTAVVEPDVETSEVYGRQDEQGGLAQIEATRRSLEAHRPWRVAVVAAALSVAALIAAVVAVAGFAFDRSHRGAVIATVHRYEAALTTHDWPTLERLLGRDFVMHNLDLGSTQDRGGFLAWARLVSDAYPDFDVVIDDVSVDGDAASISFHELGGDGRGVARRPARMTGDVVVRVVDDRIVEVWSTYDEFGLLHERARVASGG